jgi:hypothetical protein
VLCCFVFPALQGLAQINKPFEKAFIVAGKDTISGYVHFTKGRTLYRGISFSKSIEAQKERYLPSEISSYYLEESNQLFVSASILSKSKPYDSTFIRVLAIGAVDLYYFRKNNNTSDFWIRKGAEFIELKEGNVQTRTIDGHAFKVGAKPYLKTLEKIFEDCGNDTLTLPYGTPHLLRAIDRYSACRHIPLVKYNESRKSTWRFGVNAGVVSSSLVFSDRNTITRPYQYPSIAPDGRYNLIPLTKTTLTSTALAIGFSSVVYPGSAKHLSVASDITFSSRKWSAERVSLNLAYVQIPLSLRYHFAIRQNFQPILGAGIDFQLCYKSKYNNNAYEWIFSRSTPRSGADTYPDHFPVSMPAFIAKEFKPSFAMPFVALGIESFAAEAGIIAVTYRFEVGGSVTKSPIFNSSVNNHVVTISTTFRKAK